MGGRNTLSPPEVDLPQKGRINGLVEEIEYCSEGRIGVDHMGKIFAVLSALCVKQKTIAQSKNEMCHAKDAKFLRKGSQRNVLKKDIRRILTMKLFKVDVIK